jgi:hypothetical protein
MSKTLKRWPISAFCGFAIVAVLIGAGTVIFPPGGRVSKFFDTIIVSLLYWPSRLLVGGGLDCPNADSIAEKLMCIEMSFGVSALTYSAVTYILLLLVEKRSRRLGAKTVSTDKREC